MLMDRETFGNHLRGVSRARNVFVDQLEHSLGRGRQVAIIGLPAFGRTDIECDGLKRAHMIAGNRVVSGWKLPVLESHPQSVERAEVLHVTSALWSRAEETVVQALNASRRRWPWIARILKRPPQAVVLGPVRWTAGRLDACPGLVKVLRRVEELHVFVRDEDSLTFADADLRHHGITPASIAMMPSPAYAVRWELIDETDFERGKRNLIVAARPHRTEELGMMGWEVTTWEQRNVEDNAALYAAKALTGAAFVSTDIFAVHLACMVLDVPHYFYAGTMVNWHEPWFPDGSLCMLRKLLDV